MSGPVCDCDEGRHNVCHDPRNEPHYAGCPRWGTPKAPVLGVVGELPDGPYLGVPVTGDAATELLRDALIEALTDEIDWKDVDHAVTVVLPVVEAECRRRAAEELRAMAAVFRADARNLEGGQAYAHAAEDCDTRADAIEGRP